MAYAIIGIAFATYNRRQITCENPGMDTSLFFRSQVPAALSGRPDTFSLGRVIGFRISGQRGGAWKLILKSGPRCIEADPGDADCLLELSDDDFESVLRDSMNLRQLFRQGRVRVTGNLAIALHVPGLLRLLAAPAFPSGLENLFPPEESRPFMETFWPGVLHAFHGPLSRIPELAGLKEINSIADLLTAWPGTLRLADRFGGQVVDCAEAGKLYAGGHHLAFSDAEQVFPILRGMLERLRWQLQLPVNCYGRCPIYASPDSVGEALHFDQNANFIIQIRGEKIWQVARNTDVALPTDRYTSAQPFPSAELQIYGPSQLRTTLPADFEVVHMKPGSVLFLPRGYWHQTQAVGDSLSLNFTFDQPTWADIAAPEIRRRMLAHPHWRKLATGAASLDAEAAETAAETLQELLSALLDDIAPVSAGDAIARLRPSESVPAHDNNEPHVRR
jgi:50S ribosomal protein L16 3-hydroxylase